MTRFVCRSTESKNHDGNLGHGLHSGGAALGGASTHRHHCRFRGKGYTENGDATQGLPAPWWSNAPGRIRAFAPEALSAAIRPLGSEQPYWSTGTGQTII